MLEGWQGDDYLILFDETESTDFSARYEIDKYLTGYLIVGLTGWDDFIVKEPGGRLVTVPTVPIVVENLAPFEILIDPLRIQPDDRLRGKIKWYIKPVLFGGDLLADDNTTWVSIEQHIQLVKWWNDCYPRVK